MYSSGGIDHLALVENGEVRDLDARAHADRRPDSPTARGCCSWAPSRRRPRACCGSIRTPASWRRSRTSRESLIAEAYVSVPRSVVVPDHRRQDRPRASSIRRSTRTSVAPEGELPPLVVRVHGGPTAHVGSTLRPSIQFLTSRGFAVVDVNYGGSTGYGREYRERLRGTWGVVDVDDCVNCARHLAETGEVDGARMAITGGSAGGWTVLAALCFHPDVFACGADYFGVAELAGMAADTHKFESRYLDYLDPARAVGRALAAASRRQDPRARDRPAGRRGRGGAAVAVRADRRRAARERDPLRVPALRGRAARLPQGREHRRARPRRSSSSTARSSTDEFRRSAVV